MSKVYVGDIGTEFVLDCGVAINTATVMEIRIKKPSGAVATWTATLSGTQSVRYVAAANDIDEAGAWKMQAYVDTPDWRGLGETFVLQVHPAYS